VTPTETSLWSRMSKSACNGERQVKSKSKLARFAELGSLSPELDRRFASELEALDRHVALLKAMPAHKAIAVVRGVNLRLAAFLDSA
jgi:hypothetical protein